MNSPFFLDCLSLDFGLVADFGVFFAARFLFDLADSFFFGGVVSASMIDFFQSGLVGGVLTSITLDFLARFGELDGLIPSKTLDFLDREVGDLDVWLLSFGFGKVAFLEGLTMISPA